MSSLLPFKQCLFQPMQSSISAILEVNAVREVACSFGRLAHVARRIMWPWWSDTLS